MHRLYMDFTLFHQWGKKNNNLWQVKSLAEDEDNLAVVALNYISGLSRSKKRATGNMIKISLHQLWRKPVQVSPVFWVHSVVQHVAIMNERVIL